MSNSSRSTASLRAASCIEIRDAFIKGQYSAVEIVHHFFQQIEKAEPTIDALLSTRKEKALEKAQALDKKRAQGASLGRLAAVPYVLKDNIHLEGEPSTCGSKILANFVAPFSATAVALLEAEGAICLGKANLDEFAMGSSCENSAFKVTKNPWNTTCVPGGSSGGSAAAVGAGMVPFALGSDTGGSVRLPGAYCGISAFKPTYGRVSRWGLVAYGSSLDQIGPFARSCEEIGLLQSIIGAPCARDSTCVPLPATDVGAFTKPLSKGLKIGVPYHFLEGLNQSARENFENGLDVFKGLGAELVPINLDLLHYAIAVYYILATAELSTNLARFDGIRYGYRSPKAITLPEVYEFSRSEGFGAEVKRRIMIGTFVLSAGYQDAYYKKAQKVRAKIVHQFKEAFATCDVIASPVATGGAFEIGSHKDPLSLYLEDLYTIGANLAGLPALSIPSGFDRRGMPIGLQIMGPQMADADVISVGHAFQQVTKYHTQVAPVVTGV